MSKGSIRRFGTTQPIFESAEESYKIGRLVANATFFKALFRYGDFDEYHLFCPTHANCLLTERRLKEEGLPSHVLDRIRIHHIHQLPQMVSQTPFQIFHVGGWGYYWPGLVFLRQSRAGHPFPVTGLIHSLNSPQMPFDALKVLTAPVRPFDSIICTSRCGRDTLQRLFAKIEKSFWKMGAMYRGRMDMIPLGVEDHIGQNTDPVAGRQALRLEEDAFVILYLGRIAVDNKLDPGPLILSVRQLMETHPERRIRLILAGGMDRATERLLRSLLAEHRLSGHTRLVPNFEDALKGNLYAAADVYVAPVDNLQETFGISILEAMASGLPVVASDFNGYAELVEDGKTGIKVPTYWADCLGEMRELYGMMDFFTGQLLIGQSIAVDQRRFYEALERLLLNPEYRVQMGARARESVDRSYRWGTIIPRYLTLWDHLTAMAGESRDLRKKAEGCWWSVEYIDAFAHFVSLFLGEGDLLRLSPYGDKVLKGEKAPIPYSDVAAAVIHPGLVMRAIHYLDQRTVTVAELTHFLRKEAIIAPSTDLLHILWMIKQGLVERIDQGPARSG